MSQFVPMPVPLHGYLIDWFPRTLAGTEYQFIETIPGIARPEVPAIVAWFGSPIPSDGTGHYLIRTFKDPNGWMNEHWGQRFFVTMYVSLRSYDPDELSAMWLDFIRIINRTRRDMRIQQYGVEFKEILRSEAIPMDNVPESDTGDQVFMAQVDLRFEYEIAEVPDEDYIRKVTQTIQVNDSAQHVVVVSQIFERSISCGLRAFVETGD